MNVRDLAFIALTLLVGCSTREPEQPPNPGNLARTSGDYLMPPAQPAFNGILLAEQGAHRPPAGPRDLAPISLGLSFSTASAPASQPDDAAASAPSSQEAEEFDDEYADLLEPNPRAAIEQIPVNPAQRTPEAAEAARKAALEAAERALRDKIGSLPLGEDKTVLDEITAEVLAELKLEKMRVVGMTWLSGDNLDLEVEISLSDLTAAVKAAKEDADIGPLEEAGGDRCVAASATGEIPADQRG